MATTTTSPTEHRQTALDFLAASDEEFERGDVLQCPQSRCKLSRWFVPPFDRAMM